MISTYPHSEHYITLKATIPVSVTPKVKVKKFRATETFIYLTMFSATLTTEH